MSSGSTNEASSEGLDLNSEAFPLAEEDVSVVRVTESTVAVTLSVDGNLAEQVSDDQVPSNGTNCEGGTAEAGVSGEGRNLLETFAQGSDVCDGGMGASGVRGSSEEEESAGVGLIKKFSERETMESVDAVGDGKLGDQPDVALTLKLGASDAEELKERVEVIEAESSMATTGLTSEEIHVASGEKAFELENSEVLNAKADVPEPMDLDEKPYFPDENQGVEVEEVGGSTEADGVRVTDHSVSSFLQGVEVEVVGGSTEVDGVRVTDPSVTLGSLVQGVEVEGVGGSIEPDGVRDTDPSVSLGSISNCVHNTTLGTGNSDVNPSQNGIQELVAQIAETPSNPVVTDQSMDLHLTMANADHGAAFKVDTTLATEAIDESKAAVQDQNQDVGVQIASAYGYHHEDQRMGLPSPELGASPMDNQSMGLDVETVAVGGCHKLDGNLTESQSQPIASDPDAISAVVDLDSCPSTDVKRKVLEEVLNEDEQTEVKEIDADATFPRGDGNQKTVHEVLKEDGGIVAKEVCGNVNYPGEDGSRNTVDEVFVEEGSRVKEMLDDVTCRDREGNQNTADNFLKEEGGTEVMEMADNVTHLDKDVDMTTADKVDCEDEITDVRDVGDGVTCLGTDGNLKAVDEVFEEEGSRVKEMPDDVTCRDIDGDQNTADDILKEDEGTGVREMADDVTLLDKDLAMTTADKVDCEDERIEVREVGDGVTSLGTDGNLKAVEVSEEEGSRVKEMLDDLTCRDGDGNQNTADNVLKEDEGTGVKEMADDATHLDKDIDMTTADKVDCENERTEVREVGDGVACLGTDGNMKAVDEIFQKDEAREVKDGNQMILDDVTHLSSDGDHGNVGEFMKEEEGSGVKEREDDDIYSASDCLDENLTENVSRVDPHVNEMIELSELVTTTLNPGTDDRIFYGLPMEGGDFSASDLVWGKVKSHPWWPGQIFDPSDASEQAMKYRKKDSFLVAYFGDRTFAWNEASQLKPFRTYFSQMEKQTNQESFRKAVDCALDEITRRVELGLACSCTSEEVHAKNGSQMIENPGIREESSRREGVDKSFSVSSFEPEMLVEYIRALALFPYGGVDRLELVIALVQLLAVYRSRGYSCLPKFQLCGSLVENEADSLILEERKNSKEIVDDSAAIYKNEGQVLSGKVKLKSREGSFRKRKHTSEAGVHPSKKERSLSDLMAGKKAFSSDDGNESVDWKPVSSSLSGKRKAGGDSIPDDSVTQDRKRSISLSGAADADSAQPKRSFKVGESICRVASQLTGSPPILRCSSDRLRKGAVKLDHNRENSTSDGDAVSPRTPEQRRKIVLPTEHSSPEEMLSQLCLAARDPMKGYSFLTTIISFFSEFRNFICLDRTSSWKNKMSSEKEGVKKKKFPNSNMDSAESYSFEDMQDSYWTDRIVQIGPEEQPLEKSRKKRGRPRKKMVMLTNGVDDSHQCSPALDIVQHNPDDNAEQPVEIPVGSVDAKSKDCNSPAALILSFSESDADSIPSEKNLNVLFKYFGPLKESETEVLKTANCAMVVFKRRTDAEVALSSAGKFSIFGPMHVSYRLTHWPSTVAKEASSGTQLIEYVESQGIEDVAPQGIEDVAPQGDMAPLLIEDVAPQGMEDVESQGMEDMDMAPLLIEDVAPQGIEDMAPKGMEDVESQGIEDMTPQGVEDVPPQDIEDRAPQGIEDVAAQGIEDRAPQLMEDVAPEGMEDGAPLLIDDVAPQGIELSVPAGSIEDTEPAAGIEYMAPQGIEDTAPVRGNAS